MKRIFSENFLTAFCLFLNFRMQLLIPAFEFRGIKNIRHSLRKSLRLRNLVNFPCLASRSERSKLERNSLLKKPRFAARRSKRSASNSMVTFFPRDFGLISKFSLAVIILDILLRRNHAVKVSRAQLSS